MNNISRNNDKNEAKGNIKSGLFAVIMFLVFFVTVDIANFHQDNDIKPLKEIGPSVSASSHLSSSNQRPSVLNWPPIFKNGSIPYLDGFDPLPFTELRVPKFYKPLPNQPLEELGSKTEEGVDTVFIMVASYRDFQCTETVISALKNAHHPEALYIGIVDQLSDEDIPCATPNTSCLLDPSQELCIYREHIVSYKMNAEFATGPVTARHIGNRLYRGQSFALQIDAHCVFVHHWDTAVKAQWYSLSNEMAVLTHYLSDSSDSIDPVSGLSNYESRALMCNSNFQVMGRLHVPYMVHGMQPDEPPSIPDVPQLQPFWAAGFSFSRGHFMTNVPYDNRLPMMFQGEEISISVRGFTFGYDFYAPLKSVAFHEYADGSQRRKSIPTYVEHSDKHGHAGKQVSSMLRAMSIIKMFPRLADNNNSESAAWDQTDKHLYGLGEVRPVSLFYSFFLINPKDLTSAALCPFVNSGEMHKILHDGARKSPEGPGFKGPSQAWRAKGIDYYSVPPNTVKEYLQKVFKKRMRQAIRSRKRGVLKYVADCARRVDLHLLHPKLFEEAELLIAG